MPRLHESGIFPVTALAKAEHNSADTDGGSCDSDTIKSCDWCVDVEVKARPALEMLLESLPESAALAQFMPLQESEAALVLEWAIANRVPSLSPDWANVTKAAAMPGSS